MSASLPTSPWPCWEGLLGSRGSQGDRMPHVLVPPSPSCHHPCWQRPTEELSVSRRHGWRPIPDSGKDLSSPGDPTRGMSAHEMFHLCGSHSCKRPLVLHSQILGLPIMSSSPNLSHQPEAGHGWGQPTLEGREKEEEEDLHPGQLSALASPPRRKQSLEGYKGKGPREYLVVTHSVGSGDGEQRLCWWDSGRCHGWLPSASATTRSPEHRASCLAMAGGMVEASSWSLGSRHGQGAPPPRHRRQPPTTGRGRGPLFRSPLRVSVWALASYRER